MLFVSSKETLSLSRGTGGKGAKTRSYLRTQPTIEVKACHGVRNEADGYARQCYAQASETIRGPVWIVVKTHEYDEGAGHARKEGNKEYQDARPLRSHATMLSRKDSLKPPTPSGSSLELPSRFEPERHPKKVPQQKQPRAPRRGDPEWSYLTAPGRCHPERAQPV